MKRSRFFKILLLAAAVFASAGARAADDLDAVFVFRARGNMFLRDLGDNAAQLDAMRSFVRLHRDALRADGDKVRVAAYSDTMRNPDADRRRARVMASRVKSDLIVNCGLVEDDFLTTTQSESHDGMPSVVVVRINIGPAAATTPAVREPVTPPVVTDTADIVIEIIEEEITIVVIPDEPAAPRERHARWSVGVNAGLPFFSGDFRSLTPGTAYIGWMAGVQATYQISPALGVSLTADYAVNRAGSPRWGRDNLLSAAGDTYYVDQGIDTRRWGDLYSRIAMLSAGLHIDVNMSRIFAPRRTSKVNIIASPAAYVQHFDTRVHDNTLGRDFIDRSIGSDAGLGLGGDLAALVRLDPSLDLRIKGTAVWIDDNLFDDIRNLKTRDNLFWGISAGVVWKFGVR